VAIRTIRLTELKAVLQVDASGKIIKSTAPSTGTTTNVATTNITTAVTPNLTLRGDSGTVTFDITQTNLSAVGGSNVTTAVENGALVIKLNDSIALNQVDVKSVNGENTFISRDSNNKLQFGISSTGIPFMEPKSALPPLISGIVYISGSASVPEGYYLGHTGEPGTADEGLQVLEP